MGHYSEYEQHKLDEQMSQELDRQPKEVPEPTAMELQITAMSALRHPTASGNSPLGLVSYVQLLEDERLYLMSLLVAERKKR